MRTAKPIATVSYNTKEFLDLKLSELLHDEIINFYMYIIHKKEEDEAKDHIHLFLLPNVMVDTMQLEKYFIQYLPNEKLPRKTIFFVKSKSDDWILYNQHFEPYLISKGESRKYHYQKEDFFFSDQDSFEYLYSDAFLSSDWALNNQILDKLRSDYYSPADLILSGQVSWYHSSQIQSITQLIEKYGSTYRGKHKGHE